MEHPPVIANPERDDVEINTAEGLERFFACVEDVYADIEKSEAVGERAEEVKAAQEHGQQAYHDVMALIGRCIATLNAGGEVSDDDVATMQLLYNELLAATDSITATSQETSTALDPEHLIDTESDTETFANNDNDLVETITAAQESELLESVEALVDTAHTLVETYALPVEQAGRSGSSFDAAGFFFDELQKYSAKADALLLEIKKQTNALDGQIQFEQLESECANIEDNLLKLEKELESVLHPVPASEERIERLRRPATGALTIGQDEHHPTPITINVRPSVEPLPVSEAKTVPDVPVRAIQHRLDTLKPKQTTERPSQLKEHLDRALIKADDRDFVLQAFGSIENFERELEEEITRIEKLAHDWLNKSGFNNAFHTFLKDMTLAEVSTFWEQSPEVKRALLAEKNIKYEVYYEWMNKLDQDIVVSPGTKFGEAFVRAEIAFFKEKYRQ